MFHIIIKETKDYLRDKSNVFFFLIFPIAMVFLLGNLLSSMDNAEEVIGEVKIHYGIETESYVDIMTIREFIRGVEDNKNILFEEIKELDASIRMAGEGNIAAVVIFKNEPMEIHIYEGLDRIKNRTINAMMNGFSQLNKAVNIIINNNPKALLSSTDNEMDYIRRKDLGVNRTMIDYYAITMMAMLSFMSIMLGAMCFIGERQDRTIYRLKIAPINQVKLFFAKIFGLLPQTLLQILIMMVASSLIFGAKFATNLFDNLYLLLMFVVVTFTLILIGAVYGLFIQINPMVCIMPIIWIMMFLSGTHSKEIFIDGVTQYMPIYQVQEAAFDLVIFGRYQKANTVILICLSLSIILLILGAVGFSRKEEK